MSEITGQVTPNTVGIIWLARDERDSSQPHYSEIDYLVDGLLTANLKIEESRSSRLIVGENFNRSLFVLIVSEVKAAEIDSFVTLVKKDLGAENDILVIDEQDSFKQLESLLKEIAPKIRLIH